MARNSCASCSIGCEHIYKGPEGKKTRMEYENVFALGPLCGVSDADAVIAASSRCDELGLDTISTGGTIAWAMECVEKGLIDAPWLRFGDATRCSARSRRSARARASGSCSRSAHAPPRKRSATGPRSLLRTSRASSCPGYEPRTLQAMALGLAVNARGADHNRSGAYEADLSGAHDRLPAASPTSPARSRPRTAPRSWTR